MKEHEARNPRAGLYVHGMQTTHQNGKAALEKTREDMSIYYDRKAKLKPDIKVRNLVILNAKTFEPSDQQKN